MIRRSLLFFLLIIGLVVLAGCSSQVANQETKNNQANSITTTNLMSKAELKAEKIEVVHFHGNYQCWSCIMVGEYALKTIKEKFPEEYKNGTIVFKEVNGELPENRDMVMKYQVRGLSLFFKYYYQRER